MEILKLDELCRGFSCISKLIDSVSYCHAKIGYSLMTRQQCMDIFHSIIVDIPLGKTNLPDCDQLIAYGSTVVPHESIKIDGIVAYSLFQDEDDLEEPEFEEDNIYEAFQLGEIKNILKTGKSVVLMPLKSSFLEPPIVWVAVTEFDAISNVFQQLGRQAAIPCAVVDSRFTVAVSAL